ncbi:hypothetical protein QFZ99_006353 [Paraburkholderia atlantica]
MCHTIIAARETARSLRSFGPEPTIFDVNSGGALHAFSGTRLRLRRLARRDGATHQRIRLARDQPRCDRKLAAQSDLDGPDDARVADAARAAVGRARLHDLQRRLCGLRGRPASVSARPPGRRWLARSGRLQSSRHGHLSRRRHAVVSRQGARAAARRQAGRRVDGSVLQPGRAATAARRPACCRWSSKPPGGC